MLHLVSTLSFMHTAFRFYRGTKSLNMVSVGIIHGAILLLRYLIRRQIRDSTSISRKTNIVAI